MNITKTIIPLSFRREIIRRKLADLRVELAGIKGHMLAVPGLEKKCKSLDKAISRVEKWEREL